MSKAPKPPKLKNPPSIRKGDPVNTTQHAQMLQFITQNLLAVLQHFLTPDATRYEDKAAQAWRADEAKTAQAIETARKWAEQRRAMAKNGDPDGTLLEGAQHLEQLANQLATTAAPPPIDRNKLVLAIEQFEIERPLTVVKGARGNERTETVGFIDLECIVKWPSELHINNRAPHWLSTKNLWSFTLDEAGQPDIDTIHTGKIYEQAWAVTTVKIPVWIDLRPAATPVGQLLRELKMIREHALEHAPFIVLFSELAPAERYILENEKFLVGTIPELCEALGNPD